MSRAGRSIGSGEAGSALLRLTRALGPRCDFCGAGASVVALVAGHGPRSATICARCVDRMAFRLTVSPEGGDAA